MTDLTDTVATAIAKAETDPIFTKEEIAALKQVADAWRGLESFGRVARVVRTILIYIGWMVAIWMFAKATAAGWITGIAKS